MNERAMNERAITLTGREVRAVLELRQRTLRPRFPVEMGMRLWVRETWGVFSRIAGGRCSDFPGTWLTLEYKATDDNYARHVRVSRELWNHWREVVRWQKWRSPATMPRWASRITLTIKHVRRGGAIEFARSVKCQPTARS